MSVGKLIALLAEEGDDISNLEIPKEEITQPLKTNELPSKKASSDAQLTQSTEGSHSFSVPEHSRPLFPSVHRLLLEHNITNVNKIKGTGVRGMITKGDVLTFLGKTSGPLGTFKFSPTPIEEALKSGTKKGTLPAAPPKVGSSPLDCLCFFTAILFHRYPLTDQLSGVSLSPRCSNRHKRHRMLPVCCFTSSNNGFYPVFTGLKNADFDSIILDYLPPNPQRSIISPPYAKESDFLHGLY